MKSAQMAGDAAPEVLVSVGMPIYNGEAGAATAIRSILNQTYRHIELIIADNASTDRTPEIVRELAAHDPRIRVISREKNIGPALNFRGVLMEARGDFFMWAAHDDTWKESFIEKCVDAFQANVQADNVVLVMSSWVNYFSRFPFVKAGTPSMPFLNHPEPGERIRHFLSVHAGTSKANLLYGLWRSDILRDLATLVLDSDRYTYDGADIAILLGALVSHRIVLLDEVLFYKKYRRLPMVWMIHLRKFIKKYILLGYYRPVKSPLLHLEIIYTVLRSRGVQESSIPALLELARRSC